MKYFFFVLIAGLFVIGCGGEKTSEQEVDEKQVKPEIEQPEEQPKKGEQPQPEKTLKGLGPLVVPSMDPPVIGHSPDGEMLPGLALPEAMGNGKSDDKPPVGKEGLIKMAKKAMFLSSRK